MNNYEVVSMISDLDIENIQYSQDKEEQEILKEKEKLEINLDNLMIPIPFFWPVFI